jgi:hypothetical protein
MKIVKENLNCTALEFKAFGYTHRIGFTNKIIPLVRIYDRTMDVYNKKYNQLYKCNPWQIKILNFMYGNIK